MHYSAENDINLACKLSRDSLILKGHTGWVYSCNFSPVEHKIVSCASGPFKIWDSITGELLDTFISGKNYLCHFSPDGNKIASCSFDNTIKIWCIFTKKCIKTLVGNDYTTFCFNPNGSKIVACTINGSIKIYDIDSLSLIRALAAGHTSRIKSCIYSPDGNYIVSYSDNEVKTWDVASGDCIWTFSPPPANNTITILSSNFSYDGSCIAIGNGNYLQEEYGISLFDKIKILNFKTGECVKTLSNNALIAINFCSFSPDGTKIVTGSDNEGIRVWDIESGKCINHLNDNFEFVLCGNISPDGSQIVSSSNAGDIIIHNFPLK